MAAREALKILPGLSVRWSVGVNGDSFRPASHAFLAEDFVALHAHTGHDCPRMSRKYWVGLLLAAEIANRNRSAKERGETADTIRIAMQPPKQVAVVRDDSVLIAPGRPVLTSIPWRVPLGTDQSLV